MPIGGRGRERREMKPSRVHTEKLVQRCTRRTPHVWGNHAVPGRTGERCYGFRLKRRQPGYTSPCRLHRILLPPAPSTSLRIHIEQQTFSPERFYCSILAYILECDLHVDHCCCADHPVHFTEGSLHSLCESCANAFWTHVLSPLIPPRTIIVRKWMGKIDDEIGMLTEGSMASHPWAFFPA